MADGMFSLDEVMQYLSLDQQGVEELIRRDKLNAYKIGGVYLRFRKDEVMALREDTMRREKVKHSSWVQWKNFWEFNNVYIVTGAVLVVLLYFTVK